MYALGLALLPALALPYFLVFVHLDDQKSIIAALLLGMALIASGVAFFRASRWNSISLPTVAYGALLVALIGIVSAIVNGVSFTKFFGAATGVGTGGSLVVFAGAVVVGSLLSAETMRKHYLWFAGCILVLMCLTPIAILSPVLIDSFPLMWPYQPFLLIPVLLVLISLAEGSSGLQKIVLSAGAFLAAIAFIFFFEPTSALICCILLAAYAAARIAATRAILTMPWLALAAAVFLAILLSTGFKNIIPPPSLDRLSFTATEQIGQSVLFGTLTGALIGSGPDTFSSSWELKRDPALNQHTDIKQDTVVTEGYSTLLTWLITLGFLGVFVYLLCFVALLWSIGEVIFHKGLSIISDPLFNAATLVAFFGLASAAFFTINPALFYISALSLGFAANRISSRAVGEWVASRRTRLSFGLPPLLVGIVLVLLCVGQFSANALFHKGNDTQELTKKFNDLNIRAAALWPLSPYLQAAAHDLLSPQASSRPQALARASALADKAIASDPNDYAAWMVRESVIVATFAGTSTRALADARAALDTASKLAPSRSEIPLAKAALSTLNGDTAEEMKFLQQALALDPTDAHIRALLMQLQTSTPINAVR